MSELRQCRVTWRGRNRAKLGCVTLCVAAAGVCGCQSGRIGEIQIRQDGWVLAFRDSKYGTVYVANDRGVRRVGEGDYVLSTDGTRFALFKRTSGDVEWPGYWSGDELVLYHVPTGKCQRLLLPVDIPRVALIWAINRPVSVRAADREPSPLFPEGVGVFFEGESGVTLGPLEGEYWRWSETAGWETAARPEAEKCLIVSPEGRGQEQRPFLVQLGPDGWNARRTVWIRPDGTSVELLRQNDVLPSVLGLAVVFPGYVLNPFWWYGWAQAWHQLERMDNDKTVADLERAIQARRDGSAAVRNTDPDQD